VIKVYKYFLIIELLLVEFRRGKIMAKVVILCGGQGTRLREETEYKPKPMVKVGTKPILWHIMKLYSHFKLYEFVLCLGYKGDVIKEYFHNYEIMNNDFRINLGSKKNTVFLNDYEEKNWDIILANTGMNAMTGARVKCVEKYINEDFFLVTYGDAVADVNIDELIKFHKRKGKIATLTGIRPTAKYGMLETQQDTIINFNEKPRLTDYVSGGFFVFEKEIFNYLNPNDNCVLESIPLETLAKENQLSIYRHDGFWQCMDTYRDFELLNSMYKSGNTPWMIWEKEDAKRQFVEK
jgi:glucose-1-phosphate cytidylyltransferase